MKQSLLIISSILLAGSAVAQTEPAPAFNLLEASRNLRAETRTAAMADDWETARRTNAAALALQPGHPLLLRNGVLIAASGSHSETLFAALEALASAGLTFDTELLEERLGELEQADPDRLAAIQARLTANAAPRGTAEVYLEADLRDALIEGLAIDIETERVYLGGVASRAIYVFDHGSNTPQLFADAGDGLQSVFGLAVDSRNSILYAASGTVPQTPLEPDETPRTALFAFDMVSRELIAEHTFEGAGRIADFSVRDGIVYATDTEAGRVYRLSDPFAEFELVSENPGFGSLQGVVVTAGSIWVADYALGLWRIDPVTGLATLCPPPASGESLIGLDGLAVGMDGAIYAVRNGTAPMGVLRLTINRDGRLEDAVPVLTDHPRFGEYGEPTLLQVSDGRVFLVANAEWSLFAEDGSPPEAERSPTIVLTFPVE